MRADRQSTAPAYTHTHTHMKTLIRFPIKHTTTHTHTLDSIANVFRFVPHAPQDIKSMKSVISRVKGSQPAPILLVANKLDLECQREVPEAEGTLMRVAKLIIVVI